LDTAVRSNRATVQVAGGAIRLAGAPLMAEFRRTEDFRRLLLRYVFALMTQASQLSVCGQHHDIEHRFCRCLSRLFDRCGSTIFITQQRMSDLLGVRRESVSPIALALQRAGIILYVRGQMTLVNRRALELRACGCGAIIRRAFDAVSG